jgi:putative ABC transport system permease protein
LTSLAVKSLWARKRRAATTTLAVLIGVSLISGTYVLTDTINKAFDEIFTESLKGTSVVISAQQPVRQESGEVNSFSAGVLKKVREVDGVKLAAGSIFSPGGIFEQNGDRVGAQFSPKFISSRLPGPLEAAKYVEGHPALNARQVTLDKQAASDSGLSIGDKIKVAGQRRAKLYRLVGLTELGGGISFGGASVAQLTLPEAQLITDKVGQFDQIQVAAEEGVSPVELRKRIAQVVPSNLRVETAGQNASRQTSEIRDDLGFLTTALFVFATVALIVGAFVIFNTFSITVAQRVREFGLLRTLGASRPQILGSVAVESLLIGIIGAVAGLFAGLLIAQGIHGLFQAIGADIPTTALVMETRTVIVSLLIGIVVTMLSSLSPALRSTRVPPMAALADIQQPPTRRRAIVYAVLASVLLVIGVAMVLIGLFGNLKSSGEAAQLLGLGAAAVLFGVSLWSSRLVRPLAAVTGWPLEKLRGLVGRLARENSERNPGRTAATAAALMIGLALVSFVTIFAAGIKSSISSAIDRNFQGELVIQNSDNFSPIPSAGATVARKVPGVQTVSSLRYSQVKIEGSGGKPRVSALDPRDATKVLTLDWQGDTTDRTLIDMRDDQTIVDQSFADSNDLDVGDHMRILTQTGKHPSLKIVGEVKDNADLLGVTVVTQRTMSRQMGVNEDTIDLLKLAPGADAKQVQNRLENLMEKLFPTTDVLNQQELKDVQETQINQLLGLIYALLSLAIIISLFGIANTLALSIYERTRELGMLRAVGMSRRQVRRLIRYESVITALIGAVLGLILGSIFAALMSVPLADQGFSLSYPVAQLVLLMVLAGLAGVLAAIGPARRAARLDVLEALAYE